MSDLLKNNSSNFLATSNKNINIPALKKVEKYLPEIREKLKFFDRQNSQTTISLMTLTLLNGQSPYRLLRQVMCEIEVRKEALFSSQISHANLIKEINKFKDSDDPVKIAKYRHCCESLPTLESKINGSVKDIAVLIDQYNRIKEANGIDEWDEEAFEIEEKRHHVRRGFELMYRNLLVGARAASSTIEYLQQHGVHPQICLAEVSGYVNNITERIKNGEVMHSNDLEDFLDDMADKYQDNVDATCERIFGEKDILNYDYMYKSVRS